MTTTRVEALALDPSLAEFCECGHAHCDEDCPNCEAPYRCVQWVPATDEQVIEWATA